MDSEPQIFSLDDTPSCAEAMAVGCNINPFLVEIEETFGDVASRGLMSRLGGQRIFVTAKRSERSALNRACGPVVAGWITDRIGAGGWTVPVGCAAISVRRRVLIYRMARLGYGLADIATAAQCSERAVSRQKARFRAAGWLPEKGK